MDNLDTSLMSDAQMAAHDFIGRGGDEAAATDDAPEAPEKTSDDPVAESDDDNVKEPQNEEAVDDAPAEQDETAPRKWANRFDSPDDLEKAYSAIQAEFTRRSQHNAELQRNLDAALLKMRQLSMSGSDLPEERMNQLLEESAKTGVDVNTLIWAERRDSQFREQMQAQAALDGIGRYVAAHEVHQDPELRQMVFDAIGRDPDLMNSPVWLPSDKQEAMLRRQFDLLYAEARLSKIMAELPAKEAALRKVIEAEQRERRAMKRQAAPASAQRSTPPVSPSKVGDPDVEMLLTTRGNAHGLW